MFLSHFACTLSSSYTPSVPCLDYCVIFSFSRYFLDVITLSASPSNSEMFETGISWPSDLANKFKQVDGFVYALVLDKSLSCTEVLGEGYSDCSTYILRQNTYYYWYPNNDNVQYLYESFPDIVNPIEGVQNEHFINWMRTASLPKFRKLYGRIDAGVSAGESIVFNVKTNFEVRSFGGSKTLVLTKLADYGGQNYALGNSVIIMGATSLFIGFAFALRRVMCPRPLGDIRQLNWK